MEHSVREDELPRNVARNVKTAAPPQVASLRTGLRQRRTPRPALERPRPRRRHTQHPPLTPAQPKTGGLTHLPTKTRASERRIAIPTECLPSLKEHKERQDRERSQAGAAWGDSSLVFARLRRIRFHDLRHSTLDTRHSTATLLLEQGVDLVVIKELLGHAHIGVTAGVYAHLRLRLQRQAIDALST